MRSRLEYIGRIFLCRQSEAGANTEILERFPLPIKIFGNRRITGLVFTVQIGIQQRIVNIRTILFDQRTVGIVNTPIGIHFGIIAERTVRRILGIVIVYRQLVSETQCFIAIRECNTSRNRFTVGAFHDTGNMIISQTDGITHILATAVDIYRVFVSDTGTQGLRHPITVYTASHFAIQLVIFLCETGLFISISARIFTGQHFGL